MAKATIELPNGTSINIEGTPEEVRKLLEFYGAASTGRVPDSKKEKKPKKRVTAANKPDTTEQPNLPEIVNLIRNSDEAEKIETTILDRTSQVNRILLPLYIVHEELANAYGLTSGDISKITTNLGIPVQTPNVSNTLSGTAARYVMPDKMRKRGQPVRYKLSRRGVKYLGSVIAGTEDGE
jgi:hypothetical protein